MGRVCLTVLYKTLNVSSISKVEKLYSKNFDKIFHLMPMYDPKRDGVKENVIPVFENRYQISGHLAQAIDKFYSKEYDYYAIMSEDCLLNPSIASYNIEDYFKINKDTCFISDNIKAITVDVLNSTNWAFPSIFNLAYGRNGAEIMNFLPGKSEARRAYIGKAGVRTPYMNTDYLSYLQRNLVYGKRQNHPFFFRLKYGNIDIKSLTDAFVSKIEKGKSITIYPVVGSTAEFFIVPNDVMKDFAFYCGLFAAGRAHYNVAFATAMCLSAKGKIKMPKNLNEGKILDLSKNEAGCPLNLELRREKGSIRLLDENGEDILMAYPVSLDKMSFGA